MAHGKPVVAFDTEGIRQWLTDGETGICVPFGKRLAFRAAVRSLLNDPDRLRSMGRRALEVWQEKFRPRRHLEALVGHYEALVAEASL
jgi:glycosyltransferase involved in cell wall biosynthesis